MEETLLCPTVEALVSTTRFFMEPSTLPSTTR